MVLDSSGMDTRGPERRRESMMSEEEDKGGWKQVIQSVARKGAVMIRPQGQETATNVIEHNKDGCRAVTEKGVDSNSVLERV
jgi:hypothetical protein